MIGVMVAVMAVPTRVSDVIYPSSSTVLSTSSIAVSIAHFHIHKVRNSIHKYNLIPIDKMVFHAQLLNFK